MVISHLGADAIGRQSGGVDCGCGIVPDSAD
jgi:hypothetical protein